MGKMLRKMPKNGGGNWKKRAAALIIAAVVVLFGLILFFQVSEVTNGKEFWDNFDTSQQS